MASPTPTEIQRQIGASVRQRRKAAGQTLLDLAEAVGVSPNQLDAYETGRDRMAAHMLYRIAVALGVEPGALFEGVNAPAPRADLDQESRVLYDIERALATLPSPDHAMAILSLVRVFAYGGSVGHHKADPRRPPLPDNPVVSSTYLPPSTDPHPGWLQDIQARRAAIDSGALSERQADTMFAEATALEDMLFTSPADTLAGVRAQIAACVEALDRGALSPENEGRGLRTALATLDRLGGRAGGRAGA